jgi:hypothetical protein
VVEAEELAPLGGRQLNLLPGEDGRAPSPERQIAAERALARLQARWGETAVRQADLVASRRPERAFRWREGGLVSQIAGAASEASRRGGLSRAVRTPRPSVRAPVRRRVETSAPSRAVVPPDGTRPIWLHAQMEEVEIDRGGLLPNGRRRQGAILQGDRVRRIVRAAGPWRLVERWATEPVARDAYHVELADGAACWLIHDRQNESAERWLIAGTFD